MRKTIVFALGITALALVGGCRVNAALGAEVFVTPPGVVIEHPRHNEYRVPEHDSDWYRQHDGYHPIPAPRYYDQHQDWHHDS